MYQEKRASLVVESKYLEKKNLGNVNVNLGMHFDF